ncbi:hypothetical protein ACW2QC_11470 [Virgibacillus sp. FSP13]
MKRILLTSIFTLIASFLVFGTSVSADALSNEEIAQKFLKIDSKYDVGEKLSPEDAQFIKTYAKTPEKNSNDSSVSSITPFSQETFTGRAKAPNDNEQASVLGTYTLDGGLFNHSYTLSMTTKVTAGHADKIKNEYTHIAYGTFGSGGVGKVWSKTDNRSTTSSQTLYSHFTESYKAHVLYYTQVVKSTIYHDGNKSFDISVDAI